MRWATTIVLLVGLLAIQGAIGGWIDEDTPTEKRLTTSFIDGTEYKLVCYQFLLRTHVHSKRTGIYCFFSFRAGYVRRVQCTRAHIC